MIDDEVLAVVLAIIVVIGTFSISQSLFGERVVEPFSEIAVLGPKMKIGDYPKSVSVGEQFTLYAYISNHEGKVMYYSVLVKVGNKSTPINQTKPMDAPIIARFDRVLMNGENYTRMLTLSIDKEGVNQRLVFELWVYDDELGKLRYHGRWTQLWINVTKTST